MKNVKGVSKLINAENYDKKHW